MILVYYISFFCAHDNWRIYFLSITIINPII